MTCAILRHLIFPQLRAGVGEWLDPKTTLYADSWHTPDFTQSLNRFLALPEFASQDWAACLSAVRSLFLSLWSIVWDIGPI